jgi:hypothetical protein
MQRAVVFLGSAFVASGGAVFYAHYQQRSEKARMHAGVLRDIALEKLEKMEAALLTDAIATAGAGTGEGAACDNGVCTLVKKRLRDADGNVVPGSERGVLA